MFLQLTEYAKKIRVNFDNVLYYINCSSNSSHEVLNTEIKMFDKTFLYVRETPEEIDKMLQLK